MPKMPDSTTTFNLENLDEQITALKDYVLGSVADCKPAHTVELGIWKKMLEIGRMAYGSFLSTQGNGDLGGNVELKDGRVLNRLEKPHDRIFQTIFGKFNLSRYCYGTGENKKIELIPLDTRLQLPASEFSYTLQNWDQHLAVENSYQQVNEIIQNILGFTQTVDSLERMNQSMAEDVPSFLKSKPLPPKEEEGKILVMSADGKGIPMRRPSGEAPIQNHRKRGEKRNKKKMATVGTIYTIDPSPRTPEQVVESLFRNSPLEDQPKKKERPRPKYKQVFASLSQKEGDQEVSANEITFNWLELQASQRNSDSKKPSVILMDGQPCLWEARKVFFPDPETVEILDLLHVTPRIWTAAHLFHSEGSIESIGFVRNYLQIILNGEVVRAVANLKQLGKSRGLKGSKKKSLDTICKYLKKNKNRLKYDEYLKAGYPIASGVVEGACRHLIKDRMERAGMRWSEKGAQAMLDLRSTHLNEDWDEFTRFRIKSQTKKQHPHINLVKKVDWPLAA
jgi:hypothetical protein